MDLISRKIKQTQLERHYLFSVAPLVDGGGERVKLFFYMQHEYHSNGNVKYLVFFNVLTLCLTVDSRPLMEEALCTLKTDSCLIQLKVIQKAHSEALFMMLDLNFSYYLINRMLFNHYMGGGYTQTLLFTIRHFIKVHHKTINKYDRCF